MTGDHPRNTGPMLSSPRCGAKTRSGKPCRSPAVQGRKRCRMHGGAPGSGAPRGNKNALKHGVYTREAIERRKGIREFIRRSRDLIHNMSRYFPRPFLLRPSFGAIAGLDARRGLVAPLVSRTLG